MQGEHLRPSPFARRLREQSDFPDRKDAEWAAEKESFRSTSWWKLRLQPTLPTFRHLAELATWKQVEKKDENKKKIFLSRAKDFVKTEELIHQK